MIEKINFIHYRRLKAPLELSFCKNINVISGMNGTCKSSILYLISNAFQAENKNTTTLEPSSELSIINNISAQINAKIEQLTKTDRNYKDPAQNQTGILFEVQYRNGQRIGFRRHNTGIDKENSRFRLAPKYSTRGESLPTLRTVYLSLSRLLPFGELADDTPITIVKKELPDEYKEIFHHLVTTITGIKITESKPQIIKNIKTRTEYDTDRLGIDSNTASAGEDNVIVIIKNLVLLKYYYDHSPQCHDDVCTTASILLIDEIDATLHPAMQLRLLYTLIDYSESYKIQVFFTTHSLFLLEKLLNTSYKNYVLVNYLTHQDDHVTLLPEPSIQKIERHLQEIQNTSYSESRKIPVFTEDPEARVILNAIFGYFSIHCKYFRNLRSQFHFVEASIGSTVLIQIFEDTCLDVNTMNAICILDGDNTGQKKTKRNIITLPGAKNPEEMVFDYSEELYMMQDFWRTSPALTHGLTKQVYSNNIRSDILDIQRTIQQQEDSGNSTKGMKRDLNKKVFNKHINSFKLVIDYWLDNHFSELEQFYKDLRYCYRQVALLHKLDPELWPSHTTLNQN